MKKSIIDKIKLFKNMNVFNKNNEYLLSITVKSNCIILRYNNENKLYDLDKYEKLINLVISYYDDIDKIDYLKNNILDYLTSNNSIINKLEKERKIKESNKLNNQYSLF